MVDLKRLSDRELATILTHRETYRMAIVESAEEEAAQRGLSSDQWATLASSSAISPKNDETPGWVRFFQGEPVSHPRRSDAAADAPVGTRRFRAFPRVIAAVLMLVMAGLDCGSGGLAVACAGGCTVATESLRGSSGSYSLSGSEADEFARAAAYAGTIGLVLIILALAEFVASILLFARAGTVVVRIVAMLALISSVVAMLLGRTVLLAHLVRIGVASTALVATWPHKRNQADSSRGGGREPAHGG